MKESAIADNVKLIIRNRCLKQGGIAVKAGYNYKTFSNMLNGRKIVTDADVVRIAVALEVPVSELFNANLESAVKEGG